MFEPASADRARAATSSGPLLWLGWRDTARRAPQVVIGLWIFGVGISMMLLGDLGLGPWDVFHQGVSELTGIPIGTVIILTGIAIVAGFVPLREQAGVGTLLNAVLIGVAVDVTMGMVDEPTSLAVRVPLMVGGPVLIAIGSGLYIAGGLGPGPRDGIMTGLARRGIPVWKARTGIEVTVLVVGLALGGSVGVGTVWFALGIGPMVQFFLTRSPRPRS